MDFLLFLVLETLVISAPMLVWVWDRANRRDHDLVEKGKVTKTLRRYSY